MDKAESKYNPDAGISKEDEERYQKLLCENEDLQRLIVQVSFVMSVQYTCFFFIKFFFFKILFITSFCCLNTKSYKNIYIFYISGSLLSPQIFFMSIESVCTHVNWFHSIIPHECRERGAFYQRKTFIPPHLITFGSIFSVV